MKINQLNELIGSVIPEITLNVDSVYPPKTGQGKKGPWHCQNLGCSDETGKIRISVWNHSELEQTIKGTQIKIKSIAGKRGLSGVVCELNEWEKNGEVHKDLQLKVNDNGIIITQSGAQLGSKPLDTGYDKKQTVPSDIDGSQIPLATKARLESPSNTFIPPKPSTNDPSAKLRQYEALYIKCLQHSVSVTREGFSVEFEDIRNIASCFFIQGIKDGLHLQMEVKAQTDKKSELENDDIQF